MRNEFLAFAKPTIEEDEILAVVDTMRSGWITTGPKVRQFETMFAAYIGVEHAVAVNSATAALHLALDAIGIGRGDEVLVPTMTFAATAEVVRYMGATPVLVDCDPRTLNLDPAKLERHITARTRAIIPVHIAGQACDMAEIISFAEQHHLVVVEDAAHALPSHYKGQRIGSISPLTAFSFYATKTITTGEGGMLVTNDAQYAERARIMSLHGISKDAWKRYSAEGNWYYEIIAPGYKYNLTDIAAAMGMVQLEKAGRLLNRRREIANRYNHAFAPLSSVTPPYQAEERDHAWHLYILQLQLGQLSCSRNEFVRDLKARNIGVSVHFIPLHLHPYYRQNYGYSRTDLPVASACYERILSLPIYPTMSDGDVNDVIEAVYDALDKYSR